MAEEELEIRTTLSTEMKIEQEEDWNEHGSFSLCQFVCIIKDFNKAKNQSTQAS